MSEIGDLSARVQKGEYKALARAITIVENDLNGSRPLLETLVPGNTPLIGITRPPGAGKSSVVNALVSRLLKQQKRIGVIAVDPSSPFNFGSLLGDRIRLSENFIHPHLFIRSLAARGSLGGLSEKIIEITDVMKAAPFDFLFVETVGVGQSEVEIAGLADITIVVLVPDSGDEVQTMKAGLMEIADIFVVNKSDHVNADRFATSLRALTASSQTSWSISGTNDKSEWQVPVIKTVATSGDGIDELLEQIQKHEQAGLQNQRKAYLLTEKIWRIISKDKMKNVDRKALFYQVQSEISVSNFNAYLFAKSFL